MFQKKPKGLFAEASPYEIRLARTDRTSPPLQVESLAAIPTGTGDPEEARKAVESFAGAQRGTFCQAFCAAYPRDRFLHRYHAENPARSRAEDFGPKTVAADLKRDPAETSFRLLHPASGKAYDPEEALSREVLFAGAGKDALREEQRRLLEHGLYPLRMEIASVALFAGLKRAIVEEDMDGSALVLEFGEESSFGYVVNLTGLALSHSLGFGIASIAGRIRKELGLQDALSARKVMFSKTFDFRDMAASLLGGLVSQVRASTGQFEVQTGKSVQYLVLPGLPESLGWIGEILAEELGMERWKPSLGEWFGKAGLSLAESEAAREDLHDFLPLFSQMARLETQRT